MKTRNTIILSFVTGLLLGPAIGQAAPDPVPLGQAIVNECKSIAENTNSDKNCKGKCVSAINVCIDKTTGEFIYPTTALCEKKIEAALSACLAEEEG